MPGRPTYARIDLKAAINNFRQISALAPESKTLAVIKADAYGHGAVAIAAALEHETDAFAVAFIDEALALRAQGISKPLLLLEGVMSAEEMALAAEQTLWVMLHRREHFLWLNALKPANRPRVWIKIDTGMHRLGLSVAEADGLLQEFSALLSADSVLCSHLACADEQDNVTNLQQARILEELAVFHNLQLSLANSAGIANWPLTHGNWNRLGIALYGFAQPACPQLSLQPVMSLSAPIIALRTIQTGETIGYGLSWQAARTTVVATVAIGYADGYPRHARVGTPAWLHHQRIPLIGRVSMDMLTFDVTDLAAKAAVGDEVELWGGHISAAEVAECASTISYEILTRVSARVKRQYIAADNNVVTRGI